MGVSWRIECTSAFRLTHASHAANLGTAEQRPVHDAARVALAEALAASLLARDAKFASSIGHGARIELV